MSDADPKPILLSGMQPTGSLNIGHLLGALSNWVKLQETHDCLFLVVDLHAITTLQAPKELRKRTLDIFCTYLAAGVDPEKACVFVQSHVPAHAELAWALGCFSYMGELSRMTQYKDKSKKEGKNIRAGLFFYPALMAADILLYGTNLVPIGEDQRQHLELTRDLAIRFNNAYSDTFVVPEAYIPKVGGRIKSLTEPTKKMSKSDDNPKSWLGLLDPPDVLSAKIRRAVTDSGTEVRYDPENAPAISNLLTIWSALAGDAIEDLEARYVGKGYEDFKKDLAEVVVESLRPLQERYDEIRSDKSHLEALMAEGAAKAERRARKILSKVMRKVGFVPRPRA
ncbi:MAG: tryptophan--tRNA ligase [Planctomycetota bacterium]